jgi:hypothetical protein
MSVNSKLILCRVQPKEVQCLLTADFRVVHFYSCIVSCVFGKKWVCQGYVYKESLGGHLTCNKGAQFIIYFETLSCK